MQIHILSPKAKLDPACASARRDGQANDAKTTLLHKSPTPICRTHMSITTFP
eukprot:m.176691 g.176691  ORF g.176691 m.176691 type:complete len:52 (-) comp31853_c0_seq2:22-177(-)